MANENMTILQNPYLEILNSQKDRFLISLVNNSSTDRTVRLFDIANNPNDNILYSFTLPYSATYPAGSSFSFIANSVTYSYTNTANETAEDVALQLSNLGQGTWSAISTVLGGNIFSIESESIVYSDLTYNFIGWFQLSSPVSTNLNDVDFQTEDKGWVCGESGTILYTTDGGINWTEQVSGTTENLNAIFDFTTNLISCGDNGTILRSIDDGANWTSIVSGTVENLNDIRLLSLGRAISVGDNGTILSSNDGGVNWASVVSGTAENINGFDIGGVIPVLNVWAVGDNGLVTRSLGGAYAVQVSGTTENLNDVAFLTDLNGITCGDNGTILKTTDGGTNWVAQVSGTSVKLQKIAKTGINSYNICGDDGVIIVSDDGGTTWTEAESNTEKNLKSIHYQGNSRYSVGDLGEIIKYQSSSSTSTENTTSPITITGTQDYRAFLYGIIQTNYKLCFIQVRSREKNISDIRLNLINRTQDAIEKKTPMDIVVDKDAKQGDSIAYYDRSPEVFLDGLTYVDILVPANNTVDFYGFYTSYEYMKEKSNSYVMGLDDVDDTLQSGCEIKNNMTDKKEKKKVEHYVAFKFGIFTRKIKLGSKRLRLLYNK